MGTHRRGTPRGFGLTRASEQPLDRGDLPQTLLVPLAQSLTMQLEDLVNDDRIAPGQDHADLLRRHA
ncbi:MAG TPA: hypothetical protein VE800_08445, partial [Actinomycetota bacterium]|nr:hypothetical protein [Actinomycetota bacterium]